MTVLYWILDAMVVSILLGLAVRLLTTRDLFEACLLFVAYGLTLSLGWVRLGAPDIALAEAALGAGITGALFLNAIQRLARRTVGRQGDGDEGATPSETEGRT